MYVTFIYTNYVIYLTKYSKTSGNTILKVVIAIIDFISIYSTAKLSNTQKSE